MIVLYLLSFWEISSACSSYGKEEPEIKYDYCGIPNEEEVDRIVNGKRVFPHKYPWMAKVIAFDPYARCGGVIISKQDVVTASHCVTIRKHGKKTTKVKNTAYVHVGENNWKEFDKHKKIYADIVVYPKAKGYLPNYDIALLNLKEKLTFNHTVRAVCVPSLDDDRDFAGWTGIVSGWGLTHYKGKPSKKLLETKMAIISQSRCKRYFNKALKWITEIFKDDGYSVTDDGEVCAKLIKDQGSFCNGDSGGPLIVNDNGYRLVVGIVSVAVACNEKFPTYYIPQTYARVTYHVKWIQEHTRGNLLKPFIKNNLSLIL